MRHVGPVEGFLQEAPRTPKALMGGSMGGLDQGVAAAAGHVDPIVLVHQQVVVLAPPTSVDPELEPVLEHGIRLGQAPRLQSSTLPSHRVACQCWVEYLVDEPLADAVLPLLHGHLVRPVVVRVQVADPRARGLHPEVGGLGTVVGTAAFSSSCCRRAARSARSTPGWAGARGPAGVAGADGSSSRGPSTKLSTCWT